MVIKQFNQSPITTLQIVKPEISKNYFEVKSGDDIYGSIDLTQQSMARVEIHDGTFLFERHGFFKPYVTIKKEKTDQNEAVAYLDLLSQTKIMLNDTPFYFRILNLWKNQWGWTNDKNQIVLRYKPTIAGTIKGDVEFLKDFFYLKNLELLAILGVYFLVNLEDEIQNVKEIIKK